MQRITLNDIEIQLEYLNALTDSPDRPWVASTAQIGNYHLSRAYDGVCIHQMASAGGGVRTPVTPAHISKRECYDALVVFIKGIEVGKDLQWKTSP